MKNGVWTILHKVFCQNEKKVLQKTKKFHVTIFSKDLPQKVPITAYNAVLESLHKFCCQNARNVFAEKSRIVTNHKFFERKFVSKNNSSGHVKHGFDNCAEALPPNPKNFTGSMQKFNEKIFFWKF